MHDVEIERQAKRKEAKEGAAGKETAERKKAEPRQHTRSIFLDPDS
jgi:hypothetical protein